MSDMFPGSDLKIQYRVEYLADGNTIAMTAQEICPHVARCKCSPGYKVLAEGLTLDDVLDLYTDISVEIIGDVVRRKLAQLDQPAQLDHAAPFDHATPAKRAAQLEWDADQARKRAEKRAAYNTPVGAKAAAKSTS